MENNLNIGPLNPGVVVGGTAGTAMAVPYFGPIFKIAHFEFSFSLFYYFLSFYYSLLSNRNEI